MSGIAAAELANVDSFPKLVSLLRDHLDWPVQEYDFDELTYDYEPHELGLKPEETSKVREIRQLRPLITNQPLGIFFLSLEEKTISVTVLRRILRSLVFKKRAGNQSAERAAWDKEDLIFAANFGKSGDRELAFVHFSDGASTGDLPVMKVLGWNAKDTKLHNDHVADLLKSRLIWPDDTSDLDQWRGQWAGAFETRYNEVISTSKELAVRLAGLAGDIRARANQLLEAEDESGPMRTMLEAFRKNLIQDLDEDGFADMFAQTICYGMLAAKISRPGADLIADNLADMVPRTNPFLKELFANFLKLGGRDKRSGLDFDELGARDVIDMLNRAKMDAVLRDFGDRNPREDPVIHFYELFLKEYDPEKRMQRGVFYTPRPVVNFIVRGVDEILRTEFDLPLGLADTSTWAELAERNDAITIPDHVEPDAPFVQILDPATGTGTFLVEVIDLIYKRMVEHWENESSPKADIAERWNAYVPKHLLPRLTAFELMMAPYTIAHMKVGLKLSETGYTFRSDERARIFLTDALEPAQDLTLEFDFITSALAHEASAANSAKAETPITIVIGNPPYANYSANLGNVARSLVDGYRNFNGSPIRERNQLQFERNIQDDFVKFVAIGQRIINRSGAGVISYITNGTLLASNSLRGLRESIWNEFYSIREINLHGGSNEIFEGARLDQNVFDISQMVAVHFYAKSGAQRDELLAYSELIGSREEKYESLANIKLLGNNWVKIAPDSENFTFSLVDETSSENPTRLDDIFVQFGAGVKTNNDSVVINFERSRLIEQVAELRPSITKVPSGDLPISDILYRPFDVRKIYYSKDMVKSRSWPTMQHMLEGDNLGLIGSSTWTTPERFSTSVARGLIEMKSGTHDRGTTLFPIYRFEKLLDGKITSVCNLKEGFIHDWEKSTSTNFISSGSGNLVDESGPVDVLNWLTFLFHSRKYRENLRAALSRGFPIVLLPKEKKLLKVGVKIGAKISALHLSDANSASELKNPEIRFAGTGEARVEKGYPQYKNGKVMINASRWFEDVPAETWAFHIGGYQVCHKWLKDRAAKGGKNPSDGRILTEEDILQYRRTVTALTETRRIMSEIDQVIEDQGGWPDAFKFRDS
jgi:predicted helicase